MAEHPHDQDVANHLQLVVVSRPPRFEEVVVSAVISDAQDLESHAHAQQVGAVVEPGLISAMPLGD